MCASLFLHPLLVQRTCAIQKVSDSERVRYRGGENDGIIEERVLGNREGSVVLLRERNLVENMDGSDTGGLCPVHI